jgi:hypothetical protein
VNTNCPDAIQAVKPSPVNAKLIEKFVWAVGESLFTLFLATIIGGVYTITPPNGPWIRVSKKILRIPVVYQEIAYTKNIVRTER